MSGGHFDYAQYKINMIADQVEQLIKNNDSTEKNQYGERLYGNYSKATLDEFKKGLLLLRQAEIYAQRIDWLVSGDDSEAKFHERLKEDLIALEASNTARAKQASQVVKQSKCKHKWEAESALNNWRETCSKCGLTAQGSCQ
jgi:hypothetical protein